VESHLTTVLYLVRHSQRARMYAVALPSVSDATPSEARRMTLVLAWVVIDILLAVAWACRPQEYA
jgi:hypothetical protein